MVMDQVEASGKSVDDAILQALARLGRRRDEVEVEILQEPRRSVRGVGAREARVRVWLKRARPAPTRAASSGAVLTPDLADQWIDGLENEPAAPLPPPPVSPPPRSAPTRKPSIVSAPRPAPQPPVVEDDYDDEDDEEEDDFEEEQPFATQPQRVVTAPSLGDEEEELAEGAVPDDIARQASDIMRTILRHMGLPAQVEVTENDPLTINVRVGGNTETQAVLIGRRGETLAAMQLIVNLMLNRKAKDRYHVVVDVENYRHRRDDNLRSLAMRVAEQVQRSQRSMTLEPMTPYERRIVHLTLQESPYVQTQSAGEGEQRRVVISLKPRAR